MFELAKLCGRANIKYFAFIFLKFDYDQDNLIFLALSPSSRLNLFDFCFHHREICYFGNLLVFLVALHKKNTGKKTPRNCGLVLACNISD